MSNDRLAEIKARAEAATPGPSMVLNARMLSGDVFIEHAREDVPWLVSLVESLTAERDALAEGRCMADTTLRDDEHRLVLCVLPKGHRAAHDDLLGTSWTDGTHYDQSEVERLRAQAAAVEALPDEWMALTSTVLATKQEHWRGDDYVDGREFGIETCADSLRAALATTREGRVRIEPCDEYGSTVTTARAESAEAEVVTLRARLAAVEDLHWEVEGKCAHCRDCYHDDYLAWPCPTVAALATTGEGEHVAREVFTADGIPFVRCSCTNAKSPTSSRWLAEHVPNGGVAELQAVVKRHAGGRS